MSKAILNFDDIVVKKSTFDNPQYPIDTNKVDIKKIWIFDQISYCKKGFKYFIGYKVDEKVKPICIIFPNISGYVNHFDETKYMSRLIKDE